MSRVRSAGLAFLVTLAALGSAGVSAQVYRIVGPDGKVTFSDKPPADPQARPQIAPSVAMPAAAGAGGGGTLPFELRTVAGRYPVTLYTGENCGPCTAARNFLNARGIPYTERTVSTNEDIAALRRLAGDARVPFLTIGSQQVQGFSDGEWTHYMDAAGYPKTSQLPPGYRNPSPAPLVAVQQPQRRPEATQQAQQPPQVQMPSTEPAPSNPAGIRF